MSDDEAHGVHDYTADPRNADILISVNGELKKRDEASVSVFDSGYILGDGVWEGLRVKDGGIAFLPEHLKRLYAGAKTIDMDIGLTKEELTARLFDCLKANQMQDGVHIRLMVTRGIKKTPIKAPASPSARQRLSSFRNTNRPCRRSLIADKVSSRFMSAAQDRPSRIRSSTHIPN